MADITNPSENSFCLSQEWLQDLSLGSDHTQEEMYLPQALSL
jgi:hypothetical protein